MSHVCICIEREFGSGGHELSEILSKELGINAYDNQLVSLASRYGEVEEKLFDKCDEKLPSPWLFSTIHVGNKHVDHSIPSNEVLFALQSRVMRKLAKHEDAIFVGRCADYVLRMESVKLIRVFVSAPLELRIKRKMQLENLSEGAAKSLVKKMDLQRRKYYEHYAGGWGDPMNYDFVFDSSITPLHEIASIIEEEYTRLKSELD